MGFEEKSWGQGSGWGFSGCGYAHLFLAAFKFCPLSCLLSNSLFLSEKTRVPHLPSKIKERYCLAQAGLQLTIFLPLNTAITGLLPE